MLFGWRNLGTSGLKLEVHEGLSSASAHSLFPLSMFHHSPTSAIIEFAYHFFVNCLSATPPSRMAVGIRLIAYKYLSTIHRIGTAAIGLGG